MDKSALARDLLLWEIRRKELDEIEAAICDSVLQLGETVTAGNVRASYSGGRKTYQYMNYARDAIDGDPYNDPTVREFTTTKTVVNWRGVCEAMGFLRSEIPFTQSEPSVTIKRLDG